ncbi:MAG: VTC domain-containing protein, partial [Lachnospiraceae bacterium]|nr:VTC domain-containing protein [Lachnospiraceae bacterium]
MRHEEKYICSMRQLKLIEQRLKAVMPYDTNQEGDSYSIRSLYLDTGDDRFYYEGLSGVNHRSKYRIRFYNMNDGVIRLERKDSDGNLKKKKSEKISKDQVLRLLDGELCIEDVGDLGMEVYSMMRGEGLHPAVIIEYKRSAFVYPVGNVRIT